MEIKKTCKKPNPKISVEETTNEMIEIRIKDVEDILKTFSKLIKKLFIFDRI